MLLKEIKKNTFREKEENFITDKLGLLDVENARLSENLFNVRRLKRLLFV